MKTISPDDLNWLSAEFEKSRERFLRTARLHMNPQLFARMTVEDVLQETFLAACKRLEYLKKESEVPLWVQIRTLILQTLTDCERKYLACQKRDVMREVSPDASSVHPLWGLLVDSMTSPQSRLEKAERAERLRRILESLSENDRAVLELRHFEELDIRECAAVLGITPNTAEVRYIRALKRLQQLVLEQSELRP